MPIRQSITDAATVTAAITPDTIRRLSELLRDGEIDICARELCNFPGLVKRMQHMADTGNKAAVLVMVSYRNIKYGVK